MSLRWYYRPSWRPTTTDPPVEFTEHVRLYQVDVAEGAEEGNTEQSQIIVNDDDAEFTFPPLTRVWAVETEAAQSSNTLAYHGYIAHRTFRRGPSQRTSASRVIELNMADENSVLSRRVLSSASANRPAESDVERMQWLANEADGQSLIDDTQYLSTASPVLMDAVDYRGQTAKDVADDCGQASGKNYYLYFNQNLGTGIWYGAEDLTTRSSMIRLTNVLGTLDEAQNIYPISEDTALTRDPSRLASGVYYQWANGNTYVRNNAIFPLISLRDFPYSSQNVKTLAKATSRANRYLADNDSEDDRITTSVLLPRAKSTWIKAGYRIRFRATHLPGYEDEVWLRVYRLAYSETESEEWVRLTMELGTNSIPASVAEEEAGPPGSAVISFSGHIGSGSFLGGGPDVEDSYSSSAGQTATLTVGKQYRVVLTVTFCRITDPGRESDNINGLNVGIYLSPGVSTPITQGNGYNWTPDAGTNTAMLLYQDGPNYSFKSPIRSGGTAPNNSYATGSVIEGDWLTYDGPSSPTVNVALRGIALSGFWGFELAGNVELQERDA